MNAHAFVCSGRGLAAVLALVLMMTGCDSTDDGPEPLGPGEFTAEVTGALVQDLHGDASFVPAGSESGPAEGLILRLITGPALAPPPSTVPAIDTGVFLRVGGDGTPGRYTLDPADPATRCVLRLQRGPSPAVAVIYEVTGGTLTLTESVAGRRRGTFELTAEGGFPSPSGSRTVRVSGSFEAQPASE